MSAQRPKVFTVLVGVDYSDPGALALAQGLAAARPHPRNHVHVVHAVPMVETAALGTGVPPGVATSEVTVAESSDRLLEYVKETLETFHRDHPDDGRVLVERLTTHVRLTSPIQAIVQLAQDLEADLVVVGTHGRRGLSRLLLGSVAEGVVRSAPCPVLVVRPPGSSAKDADVPVIEPPCPLCVDARFASEGRELWCTQHGEHHERRHTYHVGPVRSGHQSGLLFPMSR